MSAAGLEPVIGLEVHVQLRTRTKLFCGNAVEFGAPPNVHVCPVCLGLPGALPVVNARAVELAATAALGLGCEVRPRSEFSRKSYFYPDLPKGYQITQHDRPLATGEALDVPGPEGARRVRIRRVHLEEDSGKSLHDRVAGATAVDLNRAGTPLIEIVTEPDLRSPAAARAFLTRLRQALLTLDVSDCSMEEGSLRVDANVSLRRRDKAYGTRTEVKNLNSFSAVERALRFEIRRQGRILAAGGRVEPLTLLWDADRAEARPLRSKEGGHDYRYFPEPDLPPLVLEEGWIAARRAALPELPWDRVARLQAEHGLDPAQAEVLGVSPALADYFEAVVGEGADAREAANWVRGEVLSLAGGRPPSRADFPVTPAALADLLRLLASGAVSRPAAKRVLARMARTGEAAAAVVEREGLGRVEGGEAVEAWAEEVVRAHPAEAERFRAGESRLLTFFVGEAMRLSRGRADPREAAEVLRRKLSRSG